MLYIYIYNISCAKTEPMYALTNLEELSFLTVFAFPKASSIGLACRSCLSNSPWEAKRTSYQLQGKLNQRLLVCIKHHSEQTQNSIGNTHHSQNQQGSQLQYHLLEVKQDPLSHGVLLFLLHAYMP